MFYGIVSIFYFILFSQFPLAAFAPNSRPSNNEHSVEKRCVEKTKKKKKKKATQKRKYTQTRTHPHLFVEREKFIDDMENNTKEQKIKPLQVSSSHIIASRKMRTKANNIHI